MSSLQVGVVADIVIQLLGRPGIDVAMVASLEPEGESTDRLMLTSLENDIAVIDWREIEQTVASLQRLNVPVIRAPHTLDADVPVVRPGHRKLYGIDLRSGFSATAVVEALTKLLEQRQVVTVSLLSPSGPKKPQPKEINTPLSLSASGNTNASVIRNLTNHSVDQETPAIHHPAAPAFPSQADRYRNEASLDDLVDDLNRFD
jgi:hypothetical protein